MKVLTKNKLPDTRKLESLNFNFVYCQWKFLFIFFFFFKKNICCFEIEEHPMELKLGQVVAYTHF